MNKLYRFVASSSVSFAVMHNGRMMYVNFSSFFRGKSTYSTKDGSLAKKIRSHRWFREGRISEVEEKEEEEVIQGVEENADVVHSDKPYSIIGKKMFTVVPETSGKSNEAVLHAGEQNDKSESKDEVAAEEQDSNAGEQNNEVDADNVTSFLEAKEFFVEKYNVSRSQCNSKEALSDLCKQHNVTFANYPLD